MSLDAVEDRKRARNGVGAGMWRFPAVFGPGIMVMLADTDAGSIVTAAQSGARWLIAGLMMVTTVLGLYAGITGTA